MANGQPYPTWDLASRSDTSTGDQNDGVSGDSGATPTQADSSTSRLASTGVPGVGGGAGTNVATAICYFFGQCQAVPVVYQGQGGIDHGMRRVGKPPDIPAAVSQKDMRDAIALDLTARIWTGQLHPGDQNARFTFVLGGQTFGYAVTFAGSVLTPKAIYVTTYYLSVYK